MISRRSNREIEAIRAACRVVAETLRRIEAAVAPGVATRELDRIAEECIRGAGGVPLFKGYHGFPGTICASVNDEVVHGIPGDRRLAEGEIISIDVGARLGKYCGDAAATLAVGRISPEAQRVMKVCRTALEKGIAAARAGGRLLDISRAIQRYAEAEGCSVVRQYTGHGIGREMHEEPQVPNFVMEGMRDTPLLEGMVLAIEPMVNAGGADVRVKKDRWTVVTSDGSLSAHYEHTVAITGNGADVLTKPD